MPRRIPFSYAAIALVLSAPISQAQQPARAPQSLDTMRVTAPRDVRRASYFIDAEEIAKSPRRLRDAMDVLLMLRPDMIWSRAARPSHVSHSVTSSGVAHPGMKADNFDRDAVENVWINGQRIVYPVPTATSIQMQSAYSPLAMMRRSVVAILSHVKPEHIQQIRYTEPNEGSMEGLHVDNAVFIVLKDGVVFDPVLGSRELSPGELPLAEGSALPAYRLRILGVFDLDSGAAIEGAEVTDVATGVHASTTSTGTVALAFLPEGASTLRVATPGHASAIVDVVIAADRAVPITLVLARTP